jgi:hypothetical protein
MSVGGVRQQLAGVALTSTGSHKDQSDKYRAILDQILQAASPQPELVDNLKALVDQSEYYQMIRII